MECNYKSSFRKKITKEQFKDVPTNKIKILKEIITNNQTELIKDFHTIIDNLDVPQVFRLIFLSIPQHSSEEDEIFISILYELFISFPDLNSLIYAGPEIDFICYLLIQNRSLSSMKFISVIITLNDIFENTFNHIIRFLIEEYMFLENTTKDFGRLLIINSVTMNLKCNEVYDVIEFLKRNFISPINNFSDINEIIDFFEIIDILTISLMHIPNNLINEMINIFYKAFMRFKNLIIIHKNLRSMCLSIYANLTEEGFEISGFDWKSLISNNDKKDSQLFQKIFRLLITTEEAKFDDELPYNCKKLLKNYEEEEEESE